MSDLRGGSSTLSLFQFYIAEEERLMSKLPLDGARNSLEQSKIKNTGSENKAVLGMHQLIFGGRGGGGVWNFRKNISALQNYAVAVF